MGGLPVIPYLWKSSGLALCPCLPKETSCQDLADLHHLVPPALALLVALLLPFVPSSAHSFAVGTASSVSVLISGINCV